uniref:Uncharacterized protein n=1 Tax=Lygus hesperus TaxID=30085 RepID=A0A146LHU8_LYGHE
MLLQHGSLDINVVDLYGRCAIYNLIRDSDTRVVGNLYHSTLRKQLFPHGLQIDDYTVYTALQNPSNAADDIVSLFLHYRPNSYFRDSNNVRDFELPAFHVAVATGKYDIVVGLTLHRPRM